MPRSRRHVRASVQASIRASVRVPAQGPIPTSDRASAPGRRSFTRAALASLVGVVGLAGATGCGSSAGTTGGQGASSAGSSDGFPVTLANCEAELVFESAPERVVLLESAPVTILDGIGVLDRVVARAGSFPGDYYSADLAARVEAIPTLSDDINASGHLQISQESVIAQQPDLVLGLPDGITREAMRDAGAEILVQDIYCGDAEGRASFDTLHRAIGEYGSIFGVVEEADALSTSLRERVDAVAQSGAGSEAGVSTAAALYPSVGGGPLYTYGAGSMVTAQLDALGIENAFADTADRVFEISAEPLLAADPDVLIVLFQGDGDGSDVVEEMIGADQLQGLRAVREGAVLPLLFNFCEPASPLVVDGLERISTWLGELTP